jgi:hypothetical protein
LTDCTHRLTGRAPADRRRRAAAAIALAAITVACHPSVALGDGDPASDVLAAQSLFLPEDAGVSTKAQTELSALLSASERRRFPVRVAVIASAQDLGSVTALWRHPQAYARFLAQELSLLYRGTLIVVMPDGLGVDVSSGAARPQHELASLGATGRDLGAAAIAAVERLAHIPSVHVAAPRDVAQTDHSVEWLVLALGSALVALAWVASFRARPMGERRDAG